MQMARPTGKFTKTPLESLREFNDALTLGGFDDFYGLEGDGE
tara:strand:+ start:3918 stop:4043 length:126 start_codon:yes stop_codon:yes gene_type:complete